MKVILYFVSVFRAEKFLFFQYGLSEIFKAHVENEVAWVEVYIFSGGQDQKQIKTSTG